MKTNLDYNHNQNTNNCLQPNVRPSVGTELLTQTSKKKNRTLQFYKFLLYSIKIEIKLHEFYDLVRFANQSEISLWILTVVLYTNTPDSFLSDGRSDLIKGGFLVNSIFFHLMHVIRGLFGFLLLLYFPKTFKVVEAIKKLPASEVESTLFNDLIRAVINKKVIKPLKKIGPFLLFYFMLTICNLVYDVIELIYILSNFNNISIDEGALMLTYLILAILYIGKVHF